MSCTSSLMPDTSILSDGDGLTHVTRNVSFLHTQTTILAFYSPRVYSLLVLSFTHSSKAVSPNLTDKITSQSKPHSSHFTA